jgi:aspartate/methionine/tyrosine aminotransferase
VLEERRAEYRRRRDFLVPALRGLRFSVPVMPQGAFYVYAGCSRFTNDSFGFAMDLLADAGVAIAPGIDFGAHAASEHVRFAYTNSIDRLQEGVARIERFIARNARAQPHAPEKLG